MNPQKEVPELPIFEFKTNNNWKLETAYKDSFTLDSIKKLKNLAKEPDWLPKFFKHFIVIFIFLLKFI